MSAVEKPQSDADPPRSPKDIPTDAFTTDHPDAVGVPSGPFPFRIIWPEPPTGDEVDSLDTLLPHRQLGPYKLMEEIARGGMGVIYKAEDTRLHRTVALKMLRTGPLSRPEELQRFRREAMVQAKIQHRHILPILDVGECDGVQYFTMPLVSGGSLNQRRQEFIGQAKRVVALVEKVARAVEVAHQQGILHRDIKPGNILLDENDEPLVGDFGLAKLEDPSVLLTRSDQVIGTPAYMAPEQAGSSPTHKVCVQTDVWSLGVMLYELLTGQLPFKGATSSAVIQAILHTDPPAPHSLKADLDPVLEKIILRCLEKEAPWRYPSAAALADDLARWQKGEKVASVRIPLGQRFKRCSRRKMFRVAGFLFCVLLATCCLFLSQRPYEEESRRPTFITNPEIPQSDAWADLTAPLSLGRSVVLVPAVGCPKLLGTIEGGHVQDICPHNEKRRSFFVQAVGACRVPLVPQGYFSGNYRIRLEFKHTTPGRGIVGIYALHHRVRLSDGREADTYVTLTVGKHETVEDRYQEESLASVCWLWGHFDPVVGWPEGVEPLSWQNCDPVPPKSHPTLIPDTWREMVLEVRQKDLRVYLDGRFLFQVGTRYLLPENGAGDVDQEIPLTKAEAPNAFATDGGVGVFVHSAGMSLRNMVVEPLEK